MSTTPIGGSLRRDLEAALTTDEFRKAFEELKTKDEVFRRYPTVEALVALCKPGGADQAGKDRALGAILRTLKESNTLFPLVHLMFWGALEALRRKLSPGHRDPESLFERMQWEFLQAVRAYDPDRTPRKIDVNLFLNTRRRVLDRERVETYRRRQLKRIGEMERTGLPWRVLDEAPIPPEDLEAFLLDLLQRGVITAIEQEILLETGVYRRLDVREWAAARGISYSMAHEHRQRAFLAIRKHLRGEDAPR